MDANSAVELCRVTIAAPRTRMDLALPREIPLADLLPTLLRYAGENPDDPEFLRGGWILQRMGEPGFDPSQRLSGLGIRDGEVLYLRHRDSSLPEFAFDDVADAIATAARTRRSSWEPANTRTMSLVGSGVFLAVGALAVLGSGPNWLLPTIVLLAAAVLLVLGGIALSRAFGHGTVGTLVAAGGIVYGALGGFTLLGGDDPMLSFGATHVLVAASVALVLSTAAAFGVVAGWDGFLGAVLVAVVAVLAMVARLVFDTNPEAVAAITVAVVMAMTPFLPTFAARFASLPLPQLPANAEALREQIDALPGPTVLQQAVNADRILAAMLAGSTVLAVGCSTYLIGDDSWYGPALVGVIGLAWLLRSRHFAGRPHRLWLIGGGIACLVLVAVGYAMVGAGALSTLGLVAVPSLLVAACLAAWSVSMPGRQLSPYWGRGGDILEVLILLGVIPLALGVAGVYTWVLDIIP